MYFCTQRRARRSVVQLSMTSCYPQRYENWYIRSWRPIFPTPASLTSWLAKNPNAGYPQSVNTRTIEDDLMLTGLTKSINFIVRMSYFAVRCAGRSHRKFILTYTAGMPIEIPCSTMEGPLELYRYDSHVSCYISILNKSSTYIGVPSNMNAPG